MYRSASFLFAVIIDDTPLHPNHYFLLITVLFATEFSITYLMRYLITRHATRMIHGGHWGINTLVIGSGNNAWQLTRDITCKKQQLGYILKGYVKTGYEKAMRKNYRYLARSKILTRLLKIIRSNILYLHPISVRRMRYSK